LTERVSSYLLELELSLKITSDESMYVVHQRSFGVLDVIVKRTRVRDVLSLSSREYRKSIRVNLRRLWRVATNRFPHTGKAETLSENP